MAKVTIENINQTKINYTFEWTDLKEMLRQRLEEIYGPFDDYVLEIKISQCQRGSPSYKVEEWVANAVITINHEKKDP